MKRAVVTERAPKPAGPYSQAVVDGGFVFVAGQVPVLPESGRTVEGIGDQTRQVLENVQVILNSEGLEMADVVQVRAYLTDLSDFAEFTAVYGEFFAAPFPARTTIGCQLNPGFLVEVDVIARLNGERAQ